MKKNRQVFTALALVTQLGISMLAPVILCVFIGNWLDNQFGWVTTLPLLLLGILAGARNCWSLIKDTQGLGGKKPHGKDKKSGTS